MTDVLSERILASALAVCCCICVRVCCKLKRYSLQRLLPLALQCVSVRVRVSCC